MKVFQYWKKLAILSDLIKTGENVWNSHSHDLLGQQTKVHQIRQYWGYTGAVFNKLSWLREDQ